MLAIEMQTLLAAYLDAHMAWIMLSTSRYPAPITVSRAALAMATAAQNLADFLGMKANHERVSRELWSREADKYMRLHLAWTRHI